jgi:hypothetical protein
MPFMMRLSSALGLPTLDLGGRRGLMIPHSKSLSSRNSIKKSLNSFSQYKSRSGEEKWLKKVPAEKSQ